MMECTGRNSFYWLPSSWCSWSSQVIGNLCQKVNSTMESERFKAENRFRGILSIWGANTEIHQWDEPVDKHVRTTKCFLPHIHPVTIAQTFVLCSQFHQNTIMQGWNSTIHGSGGCTDTLQIHDCHWERCLLFWESQGLYTWFMPTLLAKGNHVTSSQADDRQCKYGLSCKCS